MDLHWLPSDYRIKFILLIFAFRTYQLTRPAYHPELISSRDPYSSLNSLNKLFLSVTRPQLQSYGYGYRCFSYSAATVAFGTSHQTISGCLQIYPPCKSSLKKLLLLLPFTG